MAEAKDAREAQGVAAVVAVGIMMALNATSMTMSRLDSRAASLHRR